MGRVRAKGRYVGSAVVGRWMRLMVVASLVATLLQTWVFVPGALAADVELTPTSHNFGAVEVGTDSVSRTFIFANVFYSGGSLTLSPVTLGGANPADFLIASNTCTMFLDRFNECNFAVVFRPTAPGIRTASVAISATSGEYTAILIGTGTAASAPTTLSVAPATAVVGGDVALSATLTESAGGGALAGRSVDFTLNGTPVGSATTNGGGVASLTAPLGAIEAGVYPAGLGAAFAGGDGYAASDGAAQLTVSQPSLAATPASLVFGEQAVGTTSAAQTISVTNTTNIPVTIGDVALSGDADFLLGFNSCMNGSVLFPGEICTLAVSFSPAALGAHDAMLTITHDGADSPLAVALSGTGIPISSTLAPTSYDFGVHSVGASAAPQSFVLTNVGTDPLSIDAATLTGDGFAILNDTCVDVTIAPASTCTIVVQFSPLFAGTHGGTLTVSGLTATLNGTGVAPSLVVTPSEHDFGQQQVGTTSASAMTVVQNAGDAAVSIGVVGVSGAPFAIGDEDCSGATLDPGMTCAIAVSFAPIVTGAASGALTIDSDAPEGIVTVLLSGSGTAPDPPLLNLPATWDFGSVEVGAQSGSVALQVRPGNAAPLTIGTVTLSGDDFRLDGNTCGGTLTGDEVCGIQITFVPTGEGLRSGTLTVTSDATGNPHIVTLTGTGTMAAPPALFLPSSRHFGGFVVGTQGPSIPFFVSNNGAGLLVVGTPTIVSGGAHFAITANTCTAPLAASATCQIDIRFAPTALGEHQGQLSVPSNAASSPNTATLIGVGLAPFAPAVTLAPAALNFGEQATGTTSAAQSITLTNSGTIWLNVASIGVTGNFAQTNDCPATLLVSESCTINVTFAPTATGVASGTLTITSDAASSPDTVALSGTGTAPPTPVLALPASYDFGTQQIGATGGPAIFMPSPGSMAPVTIGTVTVAGDGFSLAENTCGGALNFGQICGITVEFAPTSVGAKSGTLTVTSDAPNSPHVVALSGTGAEPAAPAVTLAPSAWNFGEQTVGTLGAPKAFTLTNSGNAALNVASIGATGSFAQSNDCPATLPAGESCTLNVSFAPTAPGPFNGSLAVTSDAASSPDSVVLSGTGVAPLAPLITLSPTSLSFGEQQVGTTSPAQVVTLTNTGTAALTIATVAVGSGAGEFVTGTDSCTGQTIAPDGDCTIAVSFAPTTVGVKSGSLTIASDAASSPDSVALSGTGTAPPPALSLGPTSIAFGEQAVGTMGVGRRVTISNSGGGVLSVGTLSLGGVGAAQFTLGADGCAGAELAAAETCDFSVLFAPTVAGSHEATLTVPSNATNGGVALSGTGVAPVFDATPAALAFGSQTVGTTSAAQGVTVTNHGSGPGALESAAIGGSGFAIANDGCSGQTLSAGGSCVLTVSFAPVATGPASGSLTIGGATVGLGGTGVAAPIATTLAVAPVGGTYGGTVTLAATLRDSGTTAPIAGKVIAFTIGGDAVGTATTGGDGVATVAGVALGTRAAGGHPNAVAASFAGDGGALASGGTADLTVARATLTITAENQARAYGFANPPLTLSYEGFVNGEGANVLRGRATASTTATATSNVGDYPIAAAQNTLNSPNYDFAFVPGTLTVSPTPLTIAAVDKVRGYSAANPALTLRYTGFRQGDTVADLGGAPSVATAATTASPAGTYPIVVGQGAISSPNYSYTFVNGTLTVKPANVALSAVSGAATYGGTAMLTATLRQTGSAAAPIAGASITFALGGTPVGSATTDASGVAKLTNVALGGRGAGNYSGLVGASFAGNGNQAGDTATGTLRVAKAALVLRAVDLSRPVGADNPPCQVQLAPGSSFVGGDTLASLDLSNLGCNYGGANRRAPAGQYALTPRGVRSDNYAITYQGGTLTVTP